MNEKRRPNDRLRHARLQRGWTQQHIAAAIGTTPKRVWSWEAGESAPHAYYQERLCELFGKNAQELGFASGLVLVPMETPLVQERSRLLHVTTTHERIESAASIVQLSWDLWFASQPRDVVAAIIELIRKLEDMWRANTANVSYRQRIQMLLIQCHGILGSIAVDQNLYDTAHDQFVRAFKIAEETRAAEQATIYVALAGDVLRRKGDAAQGLEFLETAQKGASGAALGHINQRLSHAYAEAGDVHKFDFAIGTASDLLAYAGEGTELTRKEYTPAAVHGTRGTDLCILGRPLDSFAAFDDAEKILQQNAPRVRWQAGIDISRALALCQIGNMEDGLTLAQNGFLVAHDCKSRRHMDRVKRMLRNLEAGAHRADKRVRDLRELVTAIAIQDA